MYSAQTIPQDGPRPAATLILAREGSGAPEVLLMKRAATARFMPGAYVFPGGAVDGNDAADAVYSLSGDFPDERASRRLNVPEHGLSYYVAAAREAFEECGFLMAYDASGSMVDLTAWDEAQLHTLRNQVNRQEIDIVQLCQSHGWSLALDQLHYFAHWITPPESSLRYDTRFFLCRAPERQRPSLASGEMSELVWRTAAAALEEGAAGKLRLVYATREMLKQIADFARLETLLEYASQPREITTVIPVLPPGAVP